MCCADLPRASRTWGPRVEGHRGRWQPTPDEAGSNRLPPPCTRVCDPLPLPAPEQDAAFAMSTAAGKCQQPAAALLLQAVTIFPCICPGLDASPPASTHELTIPNDVSTVAIPLPVCLCVCTYIYIYVYIYVLYKCMSSLNTFRDTPSPDSLMPFVQLLSLVVWGHEAPAGLYPLGGFPRGNPPQCSVFLPK